MGKFIESVISDQVVFKSDQSPELIDQKLASTIGSSSTTSSRDSICEKTNKRQSIVTEVRLGVIEQSYSEALEKGQDKWYLESLPFEERSAYCVVIVDPVSTGASLAAEFDKYNYQVLRVWSAVIPEHMVNFCFHYCLYKSLCHCF